MSTSTLVPVELRFASKPDTARSPKFWFGDRVISQNKFGVIYGVDYRPADVFPHFPGWWYKIRFDSYNWLNSYPETAIEIVDSDP